MKIVYNKIIPFFGCKALTLWPFVFTRSKYMTNQDKRHEDIHGRQQREMLPIAVVLAAVLWICGCGWWSLLALPLYFYVYEALWLYALLRTYDLDQAYRQNAMEREAYMFEGDATYLQRRRPFAWVTYFKL